MNREMRRKLGKNAKHLTDTLKELGVELNDDMLKHMDPAVNNPAKLLDITRQLKEKTGKLEKLLTNSDAFKQKPTQPPEMKITIK